MRGTMVAWVAGVGWLLCSVCSLPAQGVKSSPAPSSITITPRSVHFIDPLVYFDGLDGLPYGECMPLRLEVGGAPLGRVRVGIYEPEMAGSNDVWRAATWSAALMAAQLTGFDPRSLQMSVEPRRSTDGPSAGALLAVGLVAAIRGDEIKSDVTMTGTINPDGTIGPVSGIPLKIDGAARAGKKVVLIPFGLESEVDPRTGRAVNLVQYGRQQGVDIRSVQEIWTAYELLTGRTLPHPEPRPIPPPSAEMNQLIEQRWQRWVKLTQAAQDKYATWPAFTHTEGTESQMSDATRLLAESQRFRQQGDLLAAYMTAQEAAMTAWIAHEAGRYVYQASSGSFAGWNRLPEQNEWLLKEIEKTTADMRSFRPRTFDQLAMYLIAAKAYYLGLCLHETAEDLKTLHHSAYMQLMLGKVEGDWRNSPEALRQAVFSLFAGGFQITAWLQLKAATDFVEVASHLEGKPLSKRPDLLRVAEFYRRGAEANLEIVDKLTLAPNCQKNEIPFDVGRRVFVVGDVYYGVANVGLTRVLPKLPQLLGEGEQLDYAVLAAALTSHTVSAGLVARHYSIGVELGDDFVIKKVKREQALEDWIDLSRRQTEASIGALIAQGVDATTCQASYWAARAAEQKQKPYERFEALQSYFATNLTAQILAELARADASPETAPRFDAPSTPSVPPPAAPVDNALPPPPAPTDDAPAPPAAPRPQIAPPLGVN